MDNEGPVLSHKASRDQRIDGVALGWVVRAGGGADILVDFPGNPNGGPVEASSTVHATADDLDRDVALAFLGGDPARPVVLGFIQLPPPLEIEVPLGTDVSGGDTSGDRPAGDAGSARPEVETDGERLVLSAEREIVLRCGRASLTLTRAGKVLIRGAYVLSRSSGVNRIKGGSIQIN